MYRYLRNKGIRLAGVEAIARRAMMKRQVGAISR
jgi:hypothetical protein